jgi:hypothetical protein
VSVCCDCVHSSTEPSHQLCLSCCMQHERCAALCCRSGINVFPVPIGGSLGSPVVVSSSEPLLAAEAIGSSYPVQLPCGSAACGFAA